MVWDRRSIALTALGAVAAVALTAGGIALAVHDGTAGKLASAPKTAPSRTPPRHQGPLVSPFTGEPVHRLKRVLIVKIGNTLPEHDLQLLRQFGRPAFAWSGAQPQLVPVVRHARIADLYAGTAGGYFRTVDRVEPYNLYAGVRTLLKEAPGASVARDIGFRFGPPPPGGTRTASFSVSYPAASFTVRWSARSRRWLVRMDGTPATDAAGGDLTAATVVIQYTVVRTSRFREYGIPPPYAESAGSGTAVVLRDGRAYRVRWSRPSPDSGTTYTLPSGARMTFAPGQEWVILTTTNWAKAGL